MHGVGLVGSHGTGSSTVARKKVTVKKPKMVESKMQRLGVIPFPEFRGEKIYMVPFYQSDPLPDKLRRWQKTIDAMLKTIDAPEGEKLFFMVDESIVKAGTPQRRPGIHIDGNWIEGATEDSPQLKKPLYPETIILASNVSGCAGYTGIYREDLIGKGGEASLVNVSKMQRTVMLPDFAYAGNVHFLHESLPAKVTVRRTLVRINVPWYSF